MPLKAAIISVALRKILDKTVNKEKIKENFEQASTKVATIMAAGAASVEAMPLITDQPKSEADLIAQAILAIIALFLYYRDDAGSAK